MRKKKVLNFNSGPAALPEDVLHQASEAILDYDETGLSILEIPHRGDLFKEILEESKSLVKELCGLGDDYEILWMHGGGRLQFCMMPMNFLQVGTKAGYIDTGHWASDAIKYAERYGQVSILASSKESNYTHLPEWRDATGCQYLHITTNNTIYGTQWHKIPDTNVPLVADMSSDIFGLERDYKKFSLFYAVAQKNLGAAGNTLVAIRKDFLKRAKAELPPMLSYKAHAEKGSVLNTPPVFGIYVSLLMLRWTKEKGLKAIEQCNRDKAKLLYDEIERNSLFRSSVAEKDRSIMNVCFSAVAAENNNAFVHYCQTHDITGIGGHRSVGGLRVSLYNSITLQDVEELITAMKEFEKIYK